VKNTDLKVDSAFVTYRRKLTSKTPDLFGFLDIAHVHPHAVLLLYSRDKRHSTML